MDGKQTPLTDAARQRLYPRRTYGRYHIAVLLRDAISAIARRHVGPRPEATLVDFGCGDQPYRPIFQEHVGKYVGADFATNALADVHLGADGMCPCADGSADVVLSSQVLEHVDDPERYLAECGRMLKGGGLLILSTHGLWVYHPHPQDLWRWTGAGLRRVIEAAGFEIIEFTGLMGLAGTGLQLFQDAVARRLPRRLRAMWIVPMQIVVGLADRVLGADGADACVYMVVARKKE